MAEPVTVQMNTPIRSVHLVGGTEDAAVVIDEAAELRADMEQMRADVEQALSQLDQAVAAVRSFQEEQVRSCRDQIIHLAVGIAEKILLKEIASGQYDIERIVTTALEQAPPGQKVLLRLHPDDLQSLQKLTSEGRGAALQNIEMVADPQLGRAECAIDTEQVTIEHLVAKHLRQIDQALNGGGTP